MKTSLHFHTPESTHKSKKDKIEKESHLYATDGYQEMADGEFIYFWRFTHAKDFADVGEIKTVEETTTPKSAW